MDNSELPDLSGCVVQLHLSHAGDSEFAVSQLLLEYAEWSETGRRLFLVGRVPEVGPDSWIAGRQAGVAWDTVSSYVLFKSRDEYRESLARYKPSLRDRLFR